MEQFRNIGIIGRLGSSQVLDTVRRLKRFLLDRHLHVILEDTIAELKIVVSKDMQIYPQVSCDGQNHFTCAPGDTITISKKAQKLRLIHPLDHNYYE
eukprot:gene13516-13298_t